MLLAINVNNTHTLIGVYERDRQLLEYLDGLRLRPGAPLEWRSRNYDDTLVLKVAGKRVQLGVPAARRIWVSVLQ